MQPASKYTRVVASSTDSLIENGENFWFYSAIMTSDAGATPGADTTVTFEEADGSTVIFTVILPANETIEITTAFIAHTGLAVTTGSGVNCTVFHEHAGR